MHCTTQIGLGKSLIIVRVTEMTMTIPPTVQVLFVLAM